MKGVVVGALFGTELGSSLDKATPVDVGSDVGNAVTEPV